MILLSPLSSLIDVPHKIFAYMACMILPMILPLWLVLENNEKITGTLIEIVVGRPMQ
jgi:hypothetical protein